MVSKKQIKETYIKNKLIKEPELQKPSEELPVVDGQSRHKLKYEKLSWLQKRKLKTHGESSFLINMLFSNGTSKEFIITTTAETFTYKKRTYYLYVENSWFNLTQNQYQLFYFDDYPVPIDRHIVQTGNESYFSVRPENLKGLLKMEYVKVLSHSMELDKYLKMSAIFSIINSGLSLIILIMLYNLMK